MARYARLESDVDLDEEAELRRLETGGAELVVEAAASLGGADGVLRLYTDRLEWVAESAGPGAAPTHLLPVSSINAVVGSKAGVPKAKLKVGLVDGASHVFDLTLGNGSSLGEAVAKRDLIRDTIQELT